MGERRRPIAAERAEERAEQLSELLGADFGGFVNVVDSTFDRMKEAELEIADAQARWPDKADELHAAFQILAPPELLRRTPRAYPAHVRELLERVATGHDTRPGTCAEVLAGLLHVGTVTPINAAARAVVKHCFAKVFPEATTMLRETLADFGREEHEGQLAQELSWARDKCRAEERVWPPREQPSEPPEQGSLAF